MQRQYGIEQRTSSLHYRQKAQGAIYFYVATVLDYLISVDQLRSKNFIVFMNSSNELSTV